MDLLHTFFPEIYDTHHVAYNLVKISEFKLLLEIQACGLEDDQVDVELIENVLKVSANLNDNRSYLHRGVPRRPFKYNFKLRGDVFVESAKLKNGMLSIVLEIKVPEDKKPKKIPIEH